VLCIDHPEVQALIPSVKDRQIITYGFNPQADLQVSNVKSGPEGSVFDVSLPDDSVLRDVHLPMLGEHNIKNALVALAIAYKMEVPVATMKKALENFTGVKRRFTKTGMSHDITVIDDYAHHPIEIETVLKAARMAVSGNDGRVIAVMQPHRYSRLHDLFDGFCKCFNDADSVIIADVYEAGEEPIEGADKRSLVEGIKNHGHREVFALPNRKELAHIITKVARPGDYVICMGAGDITGWAYDLPTALDAELQKAEGSAA
jgi:UDP-N-acetylmuramate--alanine ligase